MKPSVYARALLTEREGYVLKGKEDRVVQVDAELARLGVRPPREDSGVPETTKQAPLAEKATPPRPR